ncbi:MAG: alpha/beta hydrolase [Burkholderiales bacterium]|nr:alpha/beta hydrolase [Burkholderiales bacterium]
MKFSRVLSRLLLTLGFSVAAITSQAACLDNVVMVHGNTAYPSSWNSTVSTLKSRGYIDSQIYRPSWGSKTCAACNSHDSTNTNVVKTALQQAKAASCTGKIDVIGHSMGVTLAMKAINELGYAGYVNSFVGVAGAQHGLNSCGLIQSVKNKRYGAKMYSIKSWIDEIVCSGSCYVWGSHTSNVDMQNATYDFALGHFGLQSYTTSTQATLLMN